MSSERQDKSNVQIIKQEPDFKKIGMATNKFIESFHPNTKLEGDIFMCLVAVIQKDYKTYRFRMKDWMDVLKIGSSHYSSFVKSFLALGDTNFSKRARVGKGIRGGRKWLFGGVEYYYNEEGVSEEDVLDDLKGVNSWIEFTLSDWAVEWLIDLRSNFTTWQIQEYINRKSIHAKTLYVFMSRWKNYKAETGKLPEFTKEQIMDLFQTKYGRWADFNRKIWKPVWEEVIKETGFRNAKLIKAKKNGKSVLSYKIDPEWIDPQIELDFNIAQAKMIKTDNEQLRGRLKKELGLVDWQIKKLFRCLTEKEIKAGFAHFREVNVMKNGVPAIKNKGAYMVFWYSNTYGVRLIQGD